jgi:hypothetical protein
MICSRQNSSGRQRWPHSTISSLREQLRSWLRDGTASDIIHGRSWRHIEGAQPVASERVRRAAVDLTHVARGERVGNAKLTDGAVRAIRARYNAGDISYADLAREYGLSRRTIRLVVIGKRWAHVKGA